MFWNVFFCNQNGVFCTYKAIVMLCNNTQQYSMLRKQKFAMHNWTNGPNNANRIAGLLYT